MTMDRAIERAVWLDWRAHAFPALDPGMRIYLGHETCERLLPTAEQALGALDRIERDRPRCHALTLVTPFLTEAGLAAARGLIEKLLQERGEIEIVCNDWGLLWDLAMDRVGRPAVGRLLAGQAVDPRIHEMLKGPQATRERLIRHVDGTRCLLRYQAPSAEAATHFRAISVDREALGALVAAHGITRCEISHPGQGIIRTAPPAAVRRRRRCGALTASPCRLPAARTRSGTFLHVLTRTACGPRRASTVSSILLPDSGVGGPVLSEN
jgi:hypothetical protein